MSERKRTIMLGFHSPVDGRLLREWLTGLGYDVVESLDHSAGIDLVLLDSATARPLMDQAFGVKRAARYFLPVLVCIHAGEDVGRWLKAGFDDVLRLPATRDQWRARLAIMLRLRRQSEELGQKSEYLHRALIESSGDHIFLLDPNGTYVTSNDRLAHLGLDRGDKVVGRTIEQVYPQGVAAVYREQFQRVLTQGQTVVFEHDLPSGQDTYHHLDTLYPVTLPDGTVMVGGICRDITERKLAEEKLKAANQQLRATEQQLRSANQQLTASEAKFKNLSLLKKAILESPEGVIVFALDKNYCYLDFTQHHKQTMKAIWGVDVEIGRNMLGYIKFKSDREKAKKNFDRALNGEKFVLYEEYGDEKLKRTFYENRYSSVYDENNNIIGLSVYVIDITERKQAEEALRESRERLNHLLTVNPAVVYELDPERFAPIWVSPNITAMTGHTPEETRQAGWWTGHVHPDDREETKKAQARLMDEDRVAHEYRFEKKDGTYIWVRDELRLLRDKQGTAKEIVGSWMDITDRKAVEIELAKSEQRYRSVFENTGTAMIIVGEDGAIAFANRRCTATTGYSPEELLGTDWRGYVFADDLPMMENYFRLRLSDPEKAPKRYETRLVHADGSTRNVELTADIIPPTRQVVVSMLDITERVQAREDLRRASREWEEIFQAIGHPTLILSPRHTVWAANQAALKATGMTAEELTGKSCYEVFHGTSQPPECCPMERMMYSGRLEAVEMEMEALGGTFLISCTPVYNGQGELEKVIHIATDVTERVRAEEARQVLEAAIDNAQECIMVSDRGNRLTYVNRAFEKLTGYSAAEALGNTPGMLRSDQHDRAFCQNLKKTIYAGHPWQGNLTLRKKNGKFYEVYVTITPICDQAGIPEHFVSVHRDVTRERELEQRIQQNQRLEAIGTLAGGIAHDFNNLLTPIVGYTELCMANLPTGSKVREDLEEVRLAAGRATDLVRQILSFSRRSNHERKPLRVASIVKEALKLLRASIPVSIDIRQEISAAEEAVVADPTEIHQVVMNLCTNAFHAMPDGGVLTVSLKAMDLDRDACTVIPDCTPGRYLNLSVEDTGCGISPEIRNKIFEPYFTTKEEGRGTGLGLAVTHSIVAACGGAITVYSEPGVGTRFSLYLPVAEDTPTEVEDKATMIGRGHERILFVDDDPAIVALGRRTLERYGYWVTTRTDPVEALELFKKAPADFDLVITDMTMPQMTGDRLADALLKIRPALPIIVCTGFSERMNNEKAQKMGIRRLLGKPVAPGTLLATIQEIFAGAAPR